MTSLREQIVAAMRAAPACRYCRSPDRGTLVVDRALTNAALCVDEDNEPPDGCVGALADAALRVAVEACAEVAERATTDPAAKQLRAGHPSAPFPEWGQSARTGAHVAAQTIAERIRALPDERASAKKAKERGAREEDDRG